MNTKSNAALKAPATTAGSPAPANPKPTETPATTPAEAPAEPAKPDPFANLPVITLGETTNVQDLSAADTGPARKYANVHAEAVAGKFPLMRKWKHARAIFTIGHNKGGENGFKPDSVHGTVADIVAKAGRAGITAHELVTQLRIRQVNNKRSVYCSGKLPVVGWAEGWLNSAVSRNIITVHPTKQAPAIFPEAAKDAEATPEQNAAAKALADQSGGKAAEPKAEPAKDSKTETKPDAAAKA